MPAYPKTAHRAPKKVQRARARIARWAARQRAATTAGERHRLAGRQLMAAVNHAAAPDREARDLVKHIDPDVRQIVALAGLPERRARDAYLARLDAPAEPRPRLARALSLLHAAVDQLDDARRDATHAHYADWLTGQAQRIEAWHLRGERR